MLAHFNVACLKTNMLKFICTLLVLYSVPFVYGEEPMIGPGEWKIYAISYVDESRPVPDEIIIDLQQKRLNRTHYVYSGTITTNEPLDDSLGFKMDVCKFVDGGCKQFQVMTDDSFVAFANKFAEENIKTCFESMGVEPAKLPLAKGEYEVKDFLFDVLQLPDECTYGRFIAILCAMRGSASVGCIQCECEFKKKESDEDYD